MSLLLDVLLLKFALHNNNELRQVDKETKKERREIALEEHRKCEDEKKKNKEQLNQDLRRFGVRQQLKVCCSVLVL